MQEVSFLGLEHVLPEQNGRNTCVKRPARSGGIGQRSQQLMIFATVFFVHDATCATVLLTPQMHSERSDFSLARSTRFQDMLWNRHGGADKALKRQKPVNGDMLGVADDVA